MSQPPTPQQIRSWLAVQEKLRADAVNRANLRMWGSQGEREAVLNELNAQLLRIMTTPPPFTLPEVSEADREGDALLRRCAEKEQAAYTAETERLRREHHRVLVDYATEGATP